jgi:hypothetical protein
VTAFGKKSNRVRKQAMITFTIGTEEFKANYFISPQLVNDAILGCQFMMDYGNNLNFARGSVMYFRNGEVKEHAFYRSTGTVEVACSDQCVEEAIIPTLDHVGQHPVITPADCTIPSLLRRRVTFKSILQRSHN